MIFKKFTIKFLIVSVLLFSFVFAGSSRAVGMEVMVGDKTHIGTTIAQMGKDVANWAKDYSYQLYEWTRDEGIALAYKKAVGYFLKQLAYDAATYLATGDKGQDSMFYTENWGDYLSNVGDNAVGHFLEELGQSGTAKFNLCNPGIDITAKIGLGIAETKNPDEPDCTFTEMKNNWESELERDDFLQRFGSMFEPESNDFGIALSLHMEAMEVEIAEKEAATLTRDVNDGFKDVTEGISGAIKTPGAVIRDYTNDVIEKSGENYFTYTGHILADAIDVFTTTLTGKLLEEWLRKGLARSSEDTSYTGDWGDFSSSGGSYSGGSLSSRGSSGSSGGSGSSSGGSGSSKSSGSSSYSSGGGSSNYESSGSSGSGITQAKKQFESLIEPDFAIRGDYNAMNELVACSDPVNAGPNECVVTNNFRQAIENRMTVGEAMEDEYISKYGVFGFKADGLEPAYNEGVPYRSMMILRKYRIVPVGWELAAQYIMENRENLHRTFSLYDMIACFDPDDRYVGYEGENNNAWCEGLVDPSWVLKSPQNFCKREGAGPHIITAQVFGEGNDSKYMITRNEDYCADEQTCIMENDDGSCDMYGYCTEDRRKYNFEGESCDPRYNSCETFRSSNGSTLGLLQNTLDYETCDSSNVGCEMYAYATSYEDGLGVYDLDTGKVNWASTTGRIRLDEDASECDEENEGCHSFIRTNPGLGVNLLPNSDFEDYDYEKGEFAYWGSDIGTQYYDENLGVNTVLLNNNFVHSVVIDALDYMTGASDYDLGGNIFTLSFYIRNCNGEVRLGETTKTINASSGQDWSYVALSNTFPEGSGNVIEIEFLNTEGCYMDGIKLERNSPEADGVPTEYVRYGEVGTIFERLIPDYLFASCYMDSDENGFLEMRLDAPDVCSDYARYCTAKEVNCDMYTSESDNFSVPAVVSASDYCPSECVGFDLFMQTETDFEESETELLIPDTADTCSAVEVGCDEFTNLDETFSGEQREYFKNLRQCVSPETTTCNPFFVWEGSDETGYQLRVHNLDTDGSGIRNVDATVSACSTDILDANYDPACREFYDADGQVYFEIYYNTFSCTDECYPYRRTIMDDDSDLEAANCAYGGGAMQTVGGIEHCVYMAVPSEGETCSAEAAGCREYNGNSGANSRILFETSFEDGTDMNWEGGENSTASVIAGEHSLAIDTSVYFELGDTLIESRSYVLQFLVFTNDANAITEIAIENPNTNEKTSFLPEDGLAISAGGWQSLELNIEKLDHEIDVGVERIVIETSSNVFFDNIRLTEIEDRYYLIENTLADNCEYVNADPSGELLDDHGFYAGCDAYNDRDGDVHHLHEFSNLCSEDAVGCELMIDTHNYSSWKAGNWFASSTDSFTVATDTYAYVVYDESKVCNEADKGCEKVGMRYEYEYDGEPYYQYFDSYIFNNPDDYNESLCEIEAVRCDAWEYRDGISYFKDPNDMLCEWRIEDDMGVGAWNWLKIEAKRCDFNADGIIATTTNEFGEVVTGESERILCSESSDCGLMNDNYCDDSSPCDGGECIDNQCYVACVLDENDYPCKLDNNENYPPKTIGYGGPGSMVAQPLGYLEGSSWSALCPAGQGDCTEYIDPQSVFSFDVDVLKPYTLYISEDSTWPESEVNTSCDVYYVFDNETNRLVDESLVDEPTLFYYYGEEECTFNPDSYEIRKAVVDYQLENTLDKETCNGIVDFEEGCVLLNERVVESADTYNKLIFDSTADYTLPASPVLAEPGDTNQLLKVTPDRVCNTWLSCRSFIKDAEGNDVCYDVGLCERFDDNGNCSYFSPKEEGVNQVYTSSGDLDISNLTGYSLVGYSPDTSEFAQYKVGDMEQVGQLAEVPNGSFELFDDSLYPLGWTPGTANNSGNADWERDMFKVIGNPVTAQKEGIDYPMDGKAFLKFGAKDSVRSEPIDLVPGSEYIITYYINTKNLAAGQAVLDISSLGGGVFNTERSRNWEMKFHRFTAGGNTDARIEFFTSNGDGNVYIDNVSIRPALDTKDNWSVSQTCRLYPEADSLACDYYDESGKRMKGWYGYCLQYDRYPGDPDACLLWYPVDRVNGDGVEEGGGYIDRKPLYYCTAAETFIYGTKWYNETPPDGHEADTETFAKENNLGVQSSGDIDVTHRNPNGYSEDEWTLEQLGLGSVEERWLLWENIDHITIRHSSASVYCDGKFSGPWDYYYRFDKENSGNPCPKNPGGQTDCVPWGTEGLHQGGVRNDDEWYEELDPIAHELFDDDPKYDKNTTTGGIEILSTQEFGGDLVAASAGEYFGGIKTSNFDSYCNHPDYKILEVAIYPKSAFCKTVIQTVTPMGQSMHYSANVYEGSDKEYPCNSGISYADFFTCDYMADLAPFGAVSQPGLEINDWAIMSNPYMWDSREGTPNNQPLFYEEPSSSMYGTSQARMGQHLTEGTITGNLFRKYYGKWTFQSDAEGGDGIQQVMGHYEFSGAPNAGGGGSAPNVSNAKTIPSNGVQINQLVNLVFTIDVNENQLPLTSLKIDWGDETETTISGIEMRDRPEPEEPFSMYHIYSEPGGYGIRIEARDNWGAEGSGGTSVRVSGY
ncbi:hypothetical protein C0583_00890 [Candidatus Parcubacteria bacterium]|nr:MAG: hypothetical protein C0583_00890 [Candidatus Parcubacteria bacterium]